MPWIPPPAGSNPWRITNARPVRGWAEQLDEIAGMTDETDTDEVWRDVMRGIDESRPHRPLFVGL